ncbi:MAG: hypothetical protein FWF38_00640 [Spirochaetaceae bacterium]|nr:hypothetical protein [Spirochaetaceae bacterium]
MKTRIIKILSILFLSFFLFSCINIDTEITFRQNLSGEILIKYSISKAAINIGKIDKYDNFLPLPVEEQKFRELAAITNGLDFISFRQEETEGEVFINVRYGFSNIEALNAIVSNSNDKKIEVQRRGDRTYYTQKISNNKPINEETIELAKALFPDRYVNIKITAPQNIRTVSSGEITGNSAQVRYNLPQLLSNKGNVTWEVSW